MSQCKDCHYFKRFEFRNACQWEDFNSVPFWLETHRWGYEEVKENDGQQCRAFKEKED